MRKRTIAMIVAALVALMAMPAGAEVLKAFALYDEALPLMGAVRPLDDGRLLVHGAAYFPDTNRHYPDEWTDGDNEYALVNEGYMALLDADGTLLWKQGYGEPAADNYSYPMGILPDGYLLMRLRLYETVAGTQFFKVNMDNGRIEGMLPIVDVGIQVPPLTMKMLSDGYIGGGDDPVDETFVAEIGSEHPLRVKDKRFSHFDGKTVRKLDWDLQEVWSVELDGGRPSYTLMELKNGDILMSGAEDAANPENEGTWIVRRLDGKTGEDVWRVERTIYRGLSGAGDVIEEADGSLVFLSSYPYAGPEPEYGALHQFFTRMDADGNVLSSEEIDWPEREHEWSAWSLAPLGDGYVCAAWYPDVVDARDNGALLRLDKDGKVTGSVEIGRLEGGNEVWPSWLETSPNGEHVVLTGHEREKSGPQGQMGMIVGVRYMRVTDELFGQAGGKK